MCIQRRLRSAWASAQSLGIRLVWSESLLSAWRKLGYLRHPLSAQRRLWSDWADAQADLSLRWAHSHFVCFVMRRLLCCMQSMYSLCRKQDFIIQQFQFIIISIQYPKFSITTKSTFWIFCWCIKKLQHMYLDKRNAFKCIIIVFVQNFDDQLVCYATEILHLRASSGIYCNPRNWSIRILLRYAKFET